MALAMTQYRDRPGSLDLHLLDCIASFDGRLRVQLWNEIPSKVGRTGGDFPVKPPRIGSLALGGMRNWPTSMYTLKTASFFCSNGFKVACSPSG